MLTTCSSVLFTEFTDVAGGVERPKNVTAETVRELSNKTNDLERAGSTQRMNRDPDCNLVDKIKSSKYIPFAKTKQNKTSTSCIKIWTKTCQNVLTHVLT